MKKLEQFIFYFLLFAIPFQTRKILWHQSWNFNEWQAISLYGTDILLLILFGLWIFSRVKPKIERYDYFLFALVAVSAISIKNSSSFYLSTYNVLKLIEFVAFYFYIKSYAIYRFGLVRSMIVLVGGGLFQAVIAILQFFKQSSLGLRYLGESVLRPDLAGVASFFNFHGEKVMRAYGTTPHPNILAAYLFFSIFSFYFVYLYFHIYHQGRIYHPKFNLFLLVSYPLILLSFFFTFARVMIFLWFFGFVVRACLVLGRQRFKKVFGMGINKIKLIKILVLSTMVVVLFGIFYWPEAISRVKISSEDEAVQLRVFYNKESLKSVNWFGVGAGNFVNWLMVRNPNLPRNLYQPVHNIYLLIYSETGILSIAAFILFLIFLTKDFIVSTKMEKFYHYSVLLFFLSFLFVGLFDHFLWTLQQGRLMFWLVCAGLTLFKDSETLTHWRDLRSSTERVRGKILAGIYAVPENGLGFRLICSQPKKLVVNYHDGQNRTFKTNQRRSHQSQKISAL